MGDHIRFSRLLEEHLVNVMQKKFCEGEPVALTPAMLREIRDELRNEVKGIFAKSSHSLSTPALEWVGDQYFKVMWVMTNGGKPVQIAELIIQNDHDLMQMPASDIVLLSDLFNETKMSAGLEAERARRMES